MADEPQAGIGHNNPPPLIACTVHIEDLFAEAKGFLDGEPIKSEGEAEAVAKLLDDIRKARKAADEQRKVEKAPHDEAGDAVQAAWKPLLAKCDLAAQAAKDALTPWQKAIEARLMQEAVAAREEATRAAKAAQDALAANSGLEGREAAEQLLKDAKIAEKAAAKLDKAKPQVAGGSRAIGLRSTWEPELVDAVAALRYYREHQPEELKAWLLDQARKDVRGGARQIPGFSVNEDKRAA